VVLASLEPHYPPGSTWEPFLQRQGLNCGSTGGWSCSTRPGARAASA